MQKKILVIISSFRWGGINVALQNWLNAMDPEKLSVDIFVMVHSGTYEGQFKNCTILPKDYFLDAMIDHAGLKTGMTKLVSYFLKAFSKLTKGKSQKMIYSRVGNRIVKKSGYDSVIAWHEGVPTIFGSYIEHKNKVAWIHCDYANYTDTPQELEYYSKYNAVVCVSKYARSSFVRYYPTLENKTHAIYNILDVEMIRRNSKEPVTEDFLTDKFTIISVGRVSEVKQFSRIPEVAAKVKEAGCSFRWYIVGPTYPGKEYDALMANLEKYDVSECVFLTGSKDNPYSYIAKSQILVCTSLSESWGYTINEAKALSIPSVSTDWGASCESIQNGVNGFITSLDKLHEPIIRLISDSEEYGRLKTNLVGFEYDNQSLLSQIDSLL